MGGRGLALLLNVSVGAHMQPGLRMTRIGVSKGPSGLDFVKTTPQKKIFYLKAFLRNVRLFGMFVHPTQVARLFIGLFIHSSLTLAHTLA